MKVIRSILLILTLGILSSACVKEEATPEIPPPASMTMEFDNFWKTPPLQSTIDSNNPLSNFAFAAATVLWWNTVLTTQMVIPVAALSESFNHDPEWDKSSGTWVWSYTVDLPNESYTAELFGKSNSDKVDWSMYLSKVGGFTDFLWFTGSSATNNRSGLWTINKDPDSNIKEEQDGTPYLEIQWEENSTGKMEIQYTNIEIGSVNNGSYIEFGLIEDPDLNAFYNIYNIWEDNLINIKWNTTAHYGRVLSMADFQDPYWHCWTENFLNDACD